MKLHAKKQNWLDKFFIVSYCRVKTLRSFLIYLKDKFKFLDFEITKRRLSIHPSLLGHLVEERCTSSPHPLNLSPVYFIRHFVSVCFTCFTFTWFFVMPFFVSLQFVPKYLFQYLFSYILLVYMYFN